MPRAMTIAEGRSRPHAEARVLYRITKELLDPGQTLERALGKVAAHLADFGMGGAEVAVPGLVVEKKKRRRGVADKVLEEGRPVVSASGFVCVPITTLRREVVGTLSVEVAAAPSEDELQWDRRLLTVVATLIGDAVRARRDLAEDATAEARDGAGEIPSPPGELVGSSHAMTEVYRLVRQVAPYDTTVLLRGESGTGKELVAQAIHHASARAEGPFVSVNCGALPEQLVESELFGHVKGAFTGAAGARRGRFEMASGGTLFLDEVGELPLPAQVKLLRALQQGEIHRVGDEAPRRVDVRVVAATNAPLEQAIERGAFRADLYYRLNIFPIYLPPLRERKTDITLLADHFVGKHGRGRVKRISTPAIELMTAYHWPGNVRELENCVERACLLSDDGVIRAHHLPPTLQTGDSSGTTKAGSLEAMMRNFEREILIEAMKNAGGNMTAAARALETTPRILAYRLNQLGLYEMVARRRR
jgi:Nif-specific regulatory protein